MYARLFVFFLVIVAVSGAYVCPPNICAKVNCPDRDLLELSCSNGLVKEKASFCGCCHACVKQIGEETILSDESMKLFSI